VSGEQPGSPAEKRGPGRSRARSYDSGLRWLLAPFVAGSIVLVVLPALASALYAFTEYDGLHEPRYRGLAVFRALYHDPEARDSLRATLAVAGAAVPLRIGGALALALFLHRRERLATAARTATFAPVLVPDAAMALVWMWVVNPVYGPLGVAAGSLGFDGPLLLDDWGARAVVVGLATLTLGEGFLVLLAARRELPAGVYEVARLEGAGPWQTFRRVTLPLLVPVLAFLVARDLVLSLQATLVPTLLLTNGGPLNATKSLPVMVVERGFFELRFGDAAALAVVLFVGTLVVVGLELLVLRRWLRRLR
jgi:multiple sugar transport system permease protein